ncbi:MAG: hypothetical protein NVS3B20_05490 [Polyangiales bacterium]
MAEFGIHGVEKHNGEIVVIGRCYSGIIKRGDVFNSLRGDAHVPKSQGQMVNLTVMRMVAYQRDLDEIDEGLTAQLFLSGEPSVAINDGSVLSTER